MNMNEQKNERRVVAIARELHDGAAGKIPRLAVMRANRGLYHLALEGGACNQIWNTIARLENILASDDAPDLSSMAEALRMLDVLLPPELRVAVRRSGALGEWLDSPAAARA